MTGAKEQVYNLPENCPLISSSAGPSFAIMEAKEALMWIRCNPNPLGKQTSDCVVRAIAIATSQSWQSVYRDLCNLGGKECEMPNANSVWGEYLKDNGFQQFLLPDACPKCISVRAFAMKYPEGIYVIGTGSHAVAVIDGDWYDSWDSGNEVPSYFWRAA